jgi:hypothetical protein
MQETGRVHTHTIRLGRAWCRFTSHEPSKQSERTKCYQEHRSVARSTNATEHIRKTFPGASQFFSSDGTHDTKGGRTRLAGITWTGIAKKPELPGIGSQLSRPELVSRIVIDSIAPFKPNGSVQIFDDCAKNSQFDSVAASVVLAAKYNAK